LDFFKTPDDTIGFILKDHANGDPWKDIIVIYNSLSEECKIYLPYHSEWNIVANDKSAGIEPLYTVNQGFLNLAPISVSVLYREHN
jgi:pullulanase